MLRLYIYVLYSSISPQLYEREIACVTEYDHRSIAAEKRCGALYPISNIYVVVVATSSYEALDLTWIRLFFSLLL